VNLSLIFSDMQIARIIKNLSDFLFEWVIEILKVIWTTFFL
jgi:hypothetical protein